MSEQIERLEDRRNGAVTPGPLHRLAELAARRLLEPLLGDRWSADVAAEVLETSSVERWDGDLGVHVAVLILWRRSRPHARSCGRVPGRRHAAAARPRDRR